MSERHMTKPTFSGEVQFAGYSDSSRSGPRVTLRLADRGELERFIGCEGKRYMAVLVEIGDDEKPVEAAPKLAPDARPAEPHERMKPLCEWAVKACEDPAFQRWAAAMAQSIFTPAHLAAFGKRARSSEGAARVVARAVILSVCEVASRKDLDDNTDAASRLHSRVRLPFMRWVAQQAEEATA